MKKLNQRANTVAIAEAVVWIVVTLLARRQLDILAGLWQIHEPWVTLLKFAAVLALIAVAVALHGLLFRWLARKGFISTEKEG